MIDGLVIEIPKMLDKLRLAFPTASREVAGQRLIEILEHVQAAEKQIADTRGNPGDRATTYEQLYEEWFTTLLDDYAFLRSAQGDIAEYHEASRRGWRRRWWAETAIALLIALMVGWVGSNLWR